MEAPVLSKNQVRRAINKKIIKKKSIRNVLSRPKSLIWPLITDEDAEKLLSALKELLYCKHDVKVRWNELKNVPREKRKETRKAIEERMGKDSSKFLKSIVIGINGVTRALEKSILTSVIISSDVNPIEMVKHVWQSCVISHIPVIVVPSLREVVKESIGFPALIMGFHRVTSEHPLNKIYEIVCQLSTKFTDENYPYVETIELNDTIISEPITIDDSEESISDSNTLIEETKKFNVLLTRTDETKRCFVPPSSKNNTISSDLEWNSDFIEFSENMDTSENLPCTSTPRISDRSEKNKEKNEHNSEPVQKVNGSNRQLKKNEKKRQNCRYFPVSIKRLQSNPDRKKK